MYQQLIIVGNLGRDPEMRYLQDGKPVTSFSVAVNDGYGDKKKTIWVRVSAFGNQAEPCNQYLERGSKVLVEGRLTADPQTGGPRIWGDPPKASFEMIANTVKFLSSRDEASAVPAGDDEVPF